MAVIPVARHDYRNELNRIGEDIQRIKNAIPKKTALQEELDYLRDAVVKKDDIINLLQHKIDSLISLNEELLKYIDAIESVKASGGVNVSFDDAPNLIDHKMIRIRKITIPEVSVAIIE